MKVGMTQQYYDDAERNRPCRRCKGIQTPADPLNYFIFSWVARMFKREYLSNMQNPHCVCRLVWWTGFGVMQDTAYTKVLS